ncbi:fumarylacetoacetate hydrolase family protein [Nitrospirillum pindoramense]|uniref:2-dehydro-3-deoxy-D-xylonate dehydratase n=1 Tax=Nitrospirillum amazonense TaxID=28077 RepID=A0A560HED0_9PROT|nr:fumarylacetoacetate hydrolase family protein [Nitrospirillum amazonense]TWB43854.1 2-dehydro-3-deoxy-D-xylonate dehydratase [Nitrospirillum amazonense]
MGYPVDTPVQTAHDSIFPEDSANAVLLGRIDAGEGPTPVLIRNGEIFDLSGVAPTVSDLMNRLEPGQIPEGKSIGRVADWDLKPTWAGGQAVAPGRAKLLTPIDLQCIKAAGVTFAVSALERVIEERARGDAGKALEIRQALSSRVGTDLRLVKPGSENAARLKEALIADGLWSQYLEVAIGPDAEVFTKGPTLSAMGWGVEIGVRADSHWNNPEPEVVILCDGQGRARGATLGNDVNLRDFEGRSALLLSKAKDNNASCAIGPFVRLFDETFTMDHVREAVVHLNVTGEDGFVLDGKSTMSEISRDPLDLVGQTLNKNHQYPDGFALFLGTLFAPVEDRDAPGRGFTHKTGDIVTVSSPRLGSLVNKVVPCHEAAPWTFGLTELMRNLARRGLLNG